MKTFLECSGKSIKKPVAEDIAAGDSGGNPTDIAAGKTTGAVTSPGPTTLGKTKRKDEKY